MKPPQRRRAAPARYLGEVTGPPAWTPREKRQLLRLLQARRGQPEPDAAELARELPGRSEAEIRDLIQQLKGRVVREAIRRVHPGASQGPRHREAQTPAPIEVWMDLCEKMTGPLEGALTAAFSQVLTIAATEPLSLLHSKPPKQTQARGKALFLSIARGQEDPASKMPGPTHEALGPSPETSGPTPEASSSTPEGTGPTHETSSSTLEAPGPIPETSSSTQETASSTLEAPDHSPEVSGPAPKISGSSPEPPAPAPEASGPTSKTPGPAPEASSHTHEASGPASKTPGPAKAPVESPAERDFAVDFEKIYKYLSSCSRGGHGPELSAAESAIVLDLLLSLPAELPHLPCAALAKHMLQTHAHLTAPQSGPPGAEQGGPGCSAPQEPSQATPQTPKSKELRSAWQAAGICPLNPFLVPLELLGQAATPAR